jgi:hypothetical protein
LTPGYYKAAGQFNNTVWGSYFDGLEKINHRTSNLPGPLTDYKLSELIGGNPCVLIIVDHNDGSNSFARPASGIYSTLTSFPYGNIWTGDGNPAAVISGQLNNLAAKNNNQFFLLSWFTTIEGTANVDEGTTYATVNKDMDHTLAYYGWSEFTKDLFPNVFYMDFLGGVGIATGEPVNHFITSLAMAANLFLVSQNCNKGGGHI